MKWRHWSILIVLLLLNYLIISAALTQLARQQRDEHPTRTPQPTYVSPNATPLTWIVLPTNTPWPTVAPGQAEPVVTPGEIISTLPVTTTAGPVEQPTALPTTVPATLIPAPTATPLPTTEATVYVVAPGDTLGHIARRYGVTVTAIVRANNLANPNLILVGQRLIIPGAGQPGPTSAPRPAQTAALRPTKAPTRPAATATSRPRPTATPARQQFTADIVWRGDVAPNCTGPAISNLSAIRDAAGNPVNGAVVVVDCYGNSWPLNPSGKAGVYDPGHYDWTAGQNKEVDWTCTARVVELDGQKVSSSQTVSIHFDTNNCKPGGNGHQVAILNWTKWW